MNLSKEYVNLYDNYLKYINWYRWSCKRKEV